jgi:S-adenosylmethionine decarboxylase
MIVGTEWLIEATDCDPGSLRDEQTIRCILSDVIADLELKPIGSVWHKFENEGGVTGLIALTESHLACHTYPEHGTATFNLYCCRTRPEWNWDTKLRTTLLAGHVTITRVERGSADECFELAGGGR